MAQLILVRHGQSEWNALDKWQGITDTALTSQGESEAVRMADLIRDVKIDLVYTSALKRAKKTQEIIINELDLSNIPVEVSNKLDERDYGELTGMKRSDVEQEYGQDQYMKWRRGWDDTPPGGESLHNVYDRVVPFFKTDILPKLRAGKSVMVSAHGNSLRALIKYLENINDDEITKVEMPFNEVLVYTFDDMGEVIDKRIRRSAV